MKCIGVAVAAVLRASACTTDGMGPKQGWGILGGAAAGGLAGSRVGGGSGKLAATAAGTLLGAFLGSEIGVSLDRADRMYADGAFEEATTAPVGRRVAWRNRRSGNRGYVVPVREGRGRGGEYCREFQQVVYVGGRAQQAHGQACQGPDGSWEIVG